MDAFYLHLPHCSCFLGRATSSIVTSLLTPSTMDNYPLFNLFSPAFVPYLTNVSFPTLLWATSKLHIMRRLKNHSIKEGGGGRRWRQDSSWMMIER
ncbi:hypothetical protein Leryth_025776 [Lithospermum erythrorhizon]|nr:hypothetical protein Leryth_025776 [Lithospermum erythrorhizon]